uniref:RAI1 n=1 Tax=Scheffersomyces stipitis (strain ATCC 58785 / CBS 6054 / NBRC 10063 / NRRL Y-11545) TaxID=322104 RepID=UPI000A2BFBEC|nr:Chain A, RAI1 [Scheffersomyces stipitis CBS 6054]5ULJ_B Chain B, RAI1 [Scheffersomyces stipitis CBS 6054]5ULJ_C Chain C, RAI1 [Scheffersomyces stipitis CBS 6054]5ULJ_D Chain D, RAI1 [Scheffersomyces stipitis CBS 6054]
LVPRGSHMMKTLSLQSRAKTTALKQPKEIFAFARDIDGEFVYDQKIVKDENVSYYYLPDSKIDGSIDLQAGYAKFKKIPEEKNMSDMKCLLTALTKYEQEHNNGEKVNVDIITYRGLMTKLLALPYNLNDPVDLNVLAYDGQLFINSDEEIELARRKEEDEHKQQSMTPEKYDHMKRCEFSGYKFEAIATLPKPWADCSRQQIDKRGKKMVNNYEQYISVIKTGIGEAKMLLAGEVDCVWDYIPEDGKDVLSHYMELKTTRILESNGQVVNFEKKLFKTWAQCFLMGIRKVVYGFRDDSFFLRDVELYKTEEIPLLIKNNALTENKSGGKINCTTALKWYGAVIEWLLQEIPRDDTSKAYRVSFDPSTRTFTLRELMGNENSRLRNGEMLTSEFKQWRESI